jgi:hypothetical protein
MVQVLLDHGADPQKGYFDEDDSDWLSDWTEEFQDDLRKYTRALPFPVSCGGCVLIACGFCNVFTDPQSVALIAAKQANIERVRFSSILRGSFIWCCDFS